MAKVKTQAKRHSLEALNEFGGAVAESVKKDFAQEGAKDFFRQLLGISSSESSQQANEKPTNGAVDIFQAAKHPKAESSPRKQSMEKPQQRSEAAIDYGLDIAKSSEKASRLEVREINQQLQEIMAELKKLISSSKILQTEFVEVAVDQTPPQVGEYHINFFEWLLLTIRAAREKVEDSGAWLNSVKGKSGKKGYWGMFKKHGTTFGLSNERVVATQTG